LNFIDLSSEDQILDASAGTGILAQIIVERFGHFQKLVLNDPSEKMLSKAKEKEKLNKLSFIEFSSSYAEELDYPDQFFTQIVCLNSFHYYADQPAVLKHFSRLLKPGGKLWILDWNREGHFRIANKLISFLTPENINTRTLAEMTQILIEAGFSIEETERWSFRWWKFFYVKCI